MKKRSKAKEMPLAQKEMIRRALLQIETLAEALERIVEYNEVAAVWNEDMQEEVPDSDFTPQSNQYYSKASLVRKRMELVETLREIEKNIKFYY